MKKHQLAKSGFLALAIIAALGSSSLSQAADSAPPGRLSYQGFLMDGAGTPLGNANVQNFDVVFRIYNAAQGGTAIWVEQQTVTVDKGNFSIFLGEGTAVGNEPRPTLDAAFIGADASDRFIGMTVNGVGNSPAEITPRLRLLTSPYAFLAKNATAVVGPGGASILTASGTSIGINKPVPATTLDVNGVVSSTGLNVGGNITGSSLNVSGAAQVGSLQLNGPLTGAGLGSIGVIPVGGIILWSGDIAAVPSGWALCDGRTVSGKVTPDLRGRFVVGAGSTTYPVGATGGNESITLTAAQMPSHSHSYRDRYFAEVGISSAGRGSVESTSATAGSRSGSDNDNTSFAYITESTGNAGSSAPVDIRPRYYALAYIMRVQ